MEGDGRFISAVFDEVAAVGTVQSGGLGRDLEHIQERAEVCELHQGRVGGQACQARYIGRVHVSRHDDFVPPRTTSRSVRERIVGS